MTLRDHEWIATVRFYWSDLRLCWKVCSDGYEVEHENPAEALTLLFRRMRRARSAPHLRLVKRTPAGAKRSHG